MRVMQQLRRQAKASGIICTVLKKTPAEDRGCFVFCAQPFQLGTTSLGGISPFFLIFSTKVVRFNRNKAAAWLRFHPVFSKAFRIKAFS